MRNLWNNYLSSYKGLSANTWMLAFVMFINQSGAMILPFMAIYMEEELVFSDVKKGIVLGLFGLGSIIGSLYGGKLTDQLGSYKVQLMSLLCVVPLYISLAFLKKFELLCLGVLLTSSTKELFRPANSVSVAKYAKPENLTKAFSLNRMALNLGFSVGPAIGGFLAIYSFQLLFFANAFMSLTAGVLFWWYFRNKSTNALAKHKTEKIKTTDTRFKDYDFLLYSFFVALFAFCFFQLLNTLPLFYKNVALLKENQIGLLMAFNGLMVFSLEMFIIHIAEKKFTIATNLIIGMIFCGLAYTTLLFSSELSFLYLSLFFLSLSEILIMPFSSTVAVHRSNTENRGKYMGINGISYSSALIFSPIIGTWIIEKYNFSTLWGVNIVISLITILGFWHILKKWNMR